MLKMTLAKKGKIPTILPRILLGETKKILNQNYIVLKYPVVFLLIYII